ncbi:TM2 domain-containing protein [Aurantiacibacter hainanensis]|uniref:TM2 domain-containing protein n=1 Tax=Aurantiacibacter hainanensis TaxID=3076114 RepID=UPI0030C66F98
MDSRTREQLIFEAHRKSTGATYLLWFFFGFFGAHRFYLGRTGSGIAQLVLSLTIVGLIPMAFWWLIDAFLIPEMVRDENMKTIRNIEAGRQPGDKSKLSSPPPIQPQKLDPRVEEIRELRRR